MKTKKFLNSLRILLKKYNQPVTELEMTSGNYDDQGKIIGEKIPTLTTDFCEIGVYNNNLYFTVILYSNSFSNKSFSKIKSLDKIHIYGFKNFDEDYYPIKNFSFNNLVNQIKNEIYFQIQFNFEMYNLTPRNIFKRYLEIKKILEKSEAKIVNQMVQKIT